MRTAEQLLRLSYDEARNLYHRGQLSDAEWEAVAYVSAKTPFHPSSYNRHVPRPHGPTARRLAAAMLRTIWRKWKLGRRR